MKNKDLKEKDPLYRDVEYNIDRIRNKKRRYVLSYRISKFLIFLSGVVITILVGWKDGFSNRPDFNNWILLIGASVSLLTAFGELFDLKDKALGYEYFLFDLRRLRDRMCFDFYYDPEKYKNKREEYFLFFQEVMNSQKLIIKDSYEEKEKKS